MKSTRRATLAAVTAASLLVACVSSISIASASAGASSKV